MNKASSHRQPAEDLWRLDMAQEFLTWPIRQAIKWGQVSDLPESGVSYLFSGLRTA
jgi:hypothetical protein